MTIKTNRSFSLIKENIRALDAVNANKQWMSRHKQLCWRCQKDKVTKGGSIKMLGSLKKFICADCLQAKKEQSCPPTE